MKRFLTTILMAIATATLCLAQSSLNSSADNILGNYQSSQGKDSFKVRFTKNADATYKAQIYWLKDVVNPATGKKDLDVKNPDKALRSVPCDEIVLIDGLKYNSAKQQWDGAKIYDPQRGIRVNVTCKFDDRGALCLRGTVLGIGETVVWTKIN